MDLQQIDYKLQFYKHGVPFLPLLIMNKHFGIYVLEDYVHLVLCVSSHLWLQRSFVRCIVFKLFISLVQDQMSIIIGLCLQL
jgi:hypothetical protein